MFAFGFCKSFNTDLLLLLAKTTTKGSDHRPWVQRGCSFCDVVEAWWSCQENLSNWNGVCLNRRAGLATRIISR